MAMLPRFTAWRNDLHIGIDGFHPRIHFDVHHVLQNPLRSHFPRHFPWPHSSSCLRVSRRPFFCIIQSVLVIWSRIVALQPSFCFFPRHVLNFHFPIVSDDDIRVHHL